MMRIIGGFLLGSSASALAALYLAYEGLVPEANRSDTGILIAIAFIVVATICGYVHNKVVGGRFVKVHARVQENLGALIGSLGELSRYECWKVDLYVAKWSLGPSDSIPWVAKSVVAKRASADIVASTRIPESHSLTRNGIIGECFRSKLPLLWFNPISGHSSSRDAYGQFPEGDVQLLSTCGAMRVTPVKSQIDDRCVGVLSVHVEPTYAQMMAGTMETDEFSRRVLRAAEEIFQILRE